MSFMNDTTVAFWATLADLRDVEKAVARLGCRVERVNSFEHLWSLMERDLDVVITACDTAEEILYWMNGVRRAGSPTPAIVAMATQLDVDRYLRLMALGAFDCIGLPLQFGELRRILGRAVEERRPEPLLLSD